jgi:hypothetical protein
VAGFGLLTPHEFGPKIATSTSETARRE